MGGRCGWILRFVRRWCWLKGMWVIQDSRLPWAGPGSPVTRRKTNTWLHMDMQTALIIQQQFLIRIFRLNRIRGGRTILDPGGNLAPCISFSLRRRRDGWTIILYSVSIRAEEREIKKRSKLIMPLSMTCTSFQVSLVGLYTASMILNWEKGKRIAGPEEWELDIPTWQKGI